MIIARQGPPERSAGGPPPWVEAATPLPPFSSSFVFPGLKPGKTKLEEKGGIHIGFLAPGGAPLAGLFSAAPSGRRDIACPIHE